MRSVVFLLLILAGFWILYSGLKEKPADVAPVGHVHAPQTTTRTTTGTATRSATVHFETSSAGYGIFRARGCQTCHGTDGMGSRMGPSLAEVHLNYDRASLAAYLSDPNAMIERDERLLELQSKYPRVEMPAYSDLSPDELEALCVFLLEPEKH